LYSALTITSKSCLSGVRNSCGAGSAIRRPWRELIDAVARAFAGDPIVTSAVGEMAKRPAVTVTNLVNAFNPEAVVIGGKTCADPGFAAGPIPSGE
jgi:predicted NBD/HSP70 family sugar kinase